MFAERILYWETGWNIFNDHPLIGVGLGNYGFYFEKYMPAFASALDEPREILFRANYQANNKNLWTRLLSETGIIGFIILRFLVDFVMDPRFRVEEKTKSIGIYLWGM